MKKTIKAVTILVCLAGCYYFSRTCKTAISSVALDNIEALAQGENSDNYICVGSGNIDCNGIKVEKIWRWYK